MPRGKQRPAVWLWQALFWLNQGPLSLSPVPGMEELSCCQGWSQGKGRRQGGVVGPGGTQRNHRGVGGGACYTLSDQKSQHLRLLP